MLIEEVRHRIIRALHDNFLEDDKNKEALTVMGNALEKQIPKKLICIEIEKCCPVCKEGICLIGDDGNYGNYCYKCGQALDWGDE
jgi:hypothetical protein